MKDEDFCVVGITSEEFKNIFPESFSRGKNFEVFELNGKEFAMARTEIKTGVGHKEFEITTNKNITIEQDLENRIIRATTEHFLEDPLRVYRVARFAATLNFKVSEDTLKMMNSLKSELNSLSQERVFIEFSKALSAKKNISIF